MLILPQTLTQTGVTASLATLSAAVTQEPAQFVVDASPLRQFDSTALAVLLALRRQAQALGKSMVIQGLAPRLADLARLYGVTGLLGLSPTDPPVK